MRVGIALGVLFLMSGCDRQPTGTPQGSAEPTAGAGTLAVSELKPGEQPIGLAAGGVLQAASAEDKEVVTRTFRVNDASELVRGIRGANVLVLVPPRFADLSKARSFSDEGWYSVGAQDGEADVLIQGTQLGGATAASLAAAESVDRKPETVAKLANLSKGIVRSEGIVDLYFQVGNTLYNISVECQKPETDPKCRNDDYVLGLARSVSTVTLEE